MENKNNKYLITSALPYVNGELHLGHLVGCWLPSDVYARFCRAMGRDVLFVCGADEHGTPAIVGAAREGMPILEYNNKYYDKHLRAVHDFNLSFDLYGRTHTQLQEKLIHELFLRLDAQGLISERETIQPYSVDDKMFLADRQLVGTCPNCGYENARGDQCDKCGAIYEATELKNPRSVISGSDKIEARPTKNLFFLASKMQTKWQKWLAETTKKWPRSAAAIANGWANDGLRDTSITRDLSWGIPVNKPGYEDKVFYVWFDAPWGYVSISQAARPNDWDTWWKNPDCHYAQFMGKDNVKFHAVFFPEQQLAMNDNWKTVDVLKAMNFLNFEGGKFSKSSGRGIFLDAAIDIAPADAWRYALMASAPETDDNDFKIERFADIVNKDLNGMLGNFVSRVCKLVAKNFGDTVPNAGKTDIETDSINAKISELTNALDACEFRAAITALRGLYAIGNEFMTRNAPWAAIKDGNTDYAAAVLNECMNLIDLYARVSAPFIPDAAQKMQNIFATQHDLSWPKTYEHRIKAGEKFSVPENLFNRIDDETVATLVAKYARNDADTPCLITAKIVAVKPHPSRADLNVLTVDDGTTHDIQVVCGAPNVRDGMIGVYAPVGAKIPTVKKPIAQRTVAGVESYGMMCSAAEIGTDTTADKIIELDSNTKLGEQYKA